MTRTPLQVALVVLVVALVASPAVTAASSDYGVADTVTVTKGGVAEIPVQVPAGESAALAIGDETVNYRLEATVTDGNDDGEVVVQFDTRAAGADGDPVATADADDISVQSESQIRHTYRSAPVLDPGSYQLSVKSDASGDERDVGTLVIEKVASCPDELAAGSDAYGLPDVGAFAGETAEIPVSVPEGGEGTLRVTGPSGEYRLAATATDGNDDGEVVVRFDTARGGTVDHSVSTADDADAVSVASEAGDRPNLDALDGDRYGLALWPGAETPVACFSKDRAILSLDELGEYDLPDAIDSTSGDVVEVPVIVPANDTALLTIDGSDPTYRLTATLADRDGDGQVVVTFDTSNVGAEEPSVTTAEADDLLVESRNTGIVDQPLAPGEYALSLAIDADRPPGEIAQGTLVVDGEGTSTGPETGESTTTDGQPGFGAVAVLAALVGVALGLART